VSPPVKARCAETTGAAAPAAAAVAGKAATPPVNVRVCLVVPGESAAMTDAMALAEPALKALSAIRLDSAPVHPSATASNAAMTNAAAPAALATPEKTAATPGCACVFRTAPTKSAATTVAAAPAGPVVRAKRVL